MHTQPAVTITDNPKTPPTIKIDMIRLSCNGKYAVTYSCEGYLSVWEIADDAVTWKWGKKGDVNNKWDIFLDVSPDGFYIAASFFTPCYLMVWFLC
jgi:hypothetical protein